MQPFTVKPEGLYTHTKAASHCDALSHILSRGGKSLFIVIALNYSHPSWKKRLGVFLKALTSLMGQRSHT